MASDAVIGATMSQPIHELIRGVESFDRDRCIAYLRRLSRPKTDFSDEFLADLTLDRLRHIVVAAQLQAQKSLS